MKLSYVTSLIFILISSACTLQKNRFGGKLLSNGWMDCDDYSMEKIPPVGKLELQTLEMDKLCVIKITQRKNSNFRLFIFNSEGFIKVFNSIPGASMLSSTSMQVYSVFPFDEEDLEFKVDKNNILVQTTNGWNFTFDGENQKLTQVTGGEFSYSSNIDLENGGGLSLKSPSKKHLLINHGQMIGKDPTTILTNQAIVTDSHNKSCKILNSDFLEEVKNEKDVVLYTKPKLSDSKFKELLKEKCSKLDLKDI